MKKLLLLIACCLQFSNAQNTIVGEYISTTKNSNGIKLFFQEDGTYQISVFSGRYKVVNDSIVFENDINQNSYNLLFENGKKYSDKITIKAMPSNYYSLFGSDYLGIQKTENSEIEYKPLKEYFDQNEVEEYLENSYKAVESVKENEIKPIEEEKKLAFEIDRAYALHFVKFSDYNSTIEKYIIPKDVNIIDVTMEDSYLANLNLTGKIDKPNNILFLTDGKSPLNFTKKSELKIPAYVSPVKKISEKNWTYEGMKSREDVYAYDSTAVAVDTAYAVNGNDYKFKAKIEKNLKEAISNIKKDSTKYILAYYNLKDKKAEKDFNDFISTYNENVSYSMYEGYNSAYDNFNFYLATKSDEDFFIKNKIKDKSIVVLNKNGEIIASSTKLLDDVASTLNYDNSSFTTKLKETENAIVLANNLINKKTTIPELTKNLNTNYIDFFTSYNYYPSLDYNRYYSAVDTAVSVVKDYKYEEIDSAAPAPPEVAVDTAIAASVASAEYAAFAKYESDTFSFNKPEISEKILSEKLNTIFEYFNSKNIVNNDLVNILIGEISGNHLNFDLFKNENNTKNKEEIKFINYILKYNKEDSIKNKIAKTINDIIADKTENSETATYNAISYNLIAYSGNDLNILKSVINLYNKKEQGSEEANKLVDLYYTTLVNNKPLFENIDSQYVKSNNSIEYKTDWITFKSQINSSLNAQAWDILELKKTQDFERAIKWSELSNVVEKENPYSLDTLGQLYFAIGRKTEAIAIQTKAVNLAKQAGINAEEFEFALNNMKK